MASISVCNSKTRSDSVGRKQHRHARHRPLRRRLLRLELHRKDEARPGSRRAGRRALRLLVDGTDVNAAQVLLFGEDGTHLNDGHLGVELLHEGILEHARRHVPTRALDEQAGDVRTIARRSLNLLDVHLLCDIHCRHKLVERPVVLARRHLLDSVDKGLRVEEARDPRDLGQREVARPVGELQLPRQQVGEPAGERVTRGPRKLLPRHWSLEPRKRVHELLHGLGDRKITLETHIELNERALNLEEQVVHALALLQEDAGVRCDNVDALLDFEHREELGHLLENVVEQQFDPLADCRAATATAAALGRKVVHVGEERSRLLGHEVDLGVRVQAVSDRRLAVQRLINVLEVALVIGRAGRHETGEHHEAVEKLNAHVREQTRRAENAVVRVDDVSTVENLTEQVPQVIPRNRANRLEVVVGHGNRVLQIAWVEGVATVPAERAELATLACD
mmetsp:Transcript_33640/g.92172  ORF Transcript_33640/g.92172 Transcript_33640/m.92172 type:complete len:451 (-) Transcript_33640:4282-5634(-)